MNNDLEKKSANLSKEAREHKARSKRIAKMLSDNLNKTVMEKDKQQQTQLSKNERDLKRHKRIGQMLVDNLNRVVKEKHDIQLKLRFDSKMDS